jgi:hypothetical protein
MRAIVACYDTDKDTHGGRPAITNDHTYTRLCVEFDLDPI